jgi:hypothetical protein
MNTPPAALMSYADPQWNRRVRRTLDGATGTVLLGFAAALAADST